MFRLIRFILQTQYRRRATVVARAIQAGIIIARATSSSPYPLNGLFKGGYRSPAHPENVEERVPKGLLLGGLASRARPFVGEGDGVVANFVP